MRLVIPSIFLNGLQLSQNDSVNCGNASGKQTGAPSARITGLAAAQSLERLEAFALGDERLVMHIQGIPGIGKTHLLNAFAASIGEKGVLVVRIDACWCEPSPAALSRAISREIGAPESEDSAVVAASLSGEPSELSWCSTVTSLSV